MLDADADADAGGAGDDVAKRVYYRNWIGNRVRPAAGDPELPLCPGLKC